VTRRRAADSGLSASSIPGTLAEVLRNTVSLAAFFPNSILLPIRHHAVAIVVAALALAIGTGAPVQAGLGDCSQPISTGTGPNTSDCSFILRTAVGARSCALCTCDVNDSSTITTIDALVCLKKAVGQAVPLGCAPCGNVTTTTRPSTTSTSSTSTTTTIPVRCDSESDCNALPDAFRCNPHTETCEKPCTKNADCKDFYVCNKTTGYCEEPALLY
jgi:hypothetical protein